MALNNTVCVFICGLGVSSRWNMPPTGSVQEYPCRCLSWFFSLWRSSSSTLSSSQLQLMIMENKPPSWERSCRANQSVLLDFMRSCCVLSFHLHKPLRTCCGSHLHYKRRFTRSLTPLWRLNQLRIQATSAVSFSRLLLEYFASRSRHWHLGVHSSNCCNYFKWTHTTFLSFRNEGIIWTSRRPWCHDHNGLTFLPPVFRHFSPPQLHLFPGCEAVRLLIRKPQNRCPQSHIWAERQKPGAWSHEP